ncbi:YbaY family lipoprotein [Lysobacter arvi]|uniref:YbaY family lipoprotein n=1 Tax=Lysobacter arvi TaxID=3038776 RepID=A0ABU1C942_9GAMM|nr:YbaY family lipoprotein [Lysobacter arvi]MDR0181691.1 YbaY family lipoprotein [Lysobacter arvi]
MTVFRTRLAGIAPVLLSVAVAAIVAACQPQGNTTTRPAQPVTQGAHAVTGTATYRERILPPPGSTLRVQLLDTLLADTPDAVIADATVKDVAGPPIAFTLPFDPAKLRANGRYGVHATLAGPDGTPMFVSDTRVPVDPAANVPVEIAMVQAGAPKAAAAPAPTNWQCGDLRVGAAFDTVANRVTLSYGGRSRTLPLAMSGSGARYADDTGNEFWTKGDSGTLTLDGEKHECTRTNSASPWDDARSRGVAFRAVGNEPGWLVEIGPGEAPSLHAQLDFGSRTLDIAGMQPRAQGDGWTGTSANGTAVEVIVERKPCQDDAGTTFDVTARLQAGGKTYTGCGAFLAK